MTETSAAEREVMIYSSRSGNSSIKSNASTWGQLQRDLSRKGVQYDGMKVMTSDSTTLESPDAQLPLNKFILFLSPIKTKSGFDAENASYKALRSRIKLIIDSGVENAYKHFNEGKNYTNKGTAILRQLVISWEKKNKTYDTVGEALNEVEKAPKPKKQIQKITPPKPKVPSLDSNRANSVLLQEFGAELARFAQRYNAIPNMLLANAVNSINMAVVCIENTEYNWEQAEKMAQNLGM